MEVHSNEKRDWYHPITTWYPCPLVVWILLSEERTVLLEPKIQSIWVRFPRPARHVFEIISLVLY